ncbi:Low-temperature-induced 65 kDa-like protein [Quillaja saponaria]|uniref:Low-temperature-induced 65 kDa-like protein n=1 Tax=Quillaja saponaria TaxID=32244 RepID=A0AAD7VFX3_QUISA|nr:Low-temperature-induced 65 kDa-like protein [Quillaja saponaria]
MSQPRTLSNQSSYTEKITSATSSLSDKAITAKNVVASKLGYGEKGETDENRTTNEVNRSGEGTGTTVSGSAADYGKKIAYTVTEKLSPVYEKVAGARSAVMSKMPGTGTGTTSSSGISGTETERRATRQDKGVSVKDYLAEKLRPGDEDRALSEVISEALHKRKTEEAEQTEQRPMEKVTESEEVAKQLGTGDDDSARRVQASYINSPGQGVVDKLKGAVGSWFGQTGETQPSQGQGAVTRDSREVDHGTEKRRLQESSN